MTDELLQKRWLCESKQWVNVLKQVNFVITHMLH